MTTNMHLPDHVHSVQVNGATVHSIAVLVLKSTQAGLSETTIPVFPGKDIFVGRDEDTCYPCIHSSIVSRVHFRIYSVIYDDDLVAEYQPMIYCEDRQSSNGTYVNNSLIGMYSSPRSPYLLSDGDVVSIRPDWTFLFFQTGQKSDTKLESLQAQEIELFSDRYTICNRLLGSGVYGNVYLAHDIINQKQVACKVVDLGKSSANPDKQVTSIDSFNMMEIQAFAEQGRRVTEVRRKLLREIEILSKLNHPNIATLHKAFRTPHSIYIFNELATGGDLFSFLQANGSFLEDLHARIISRQIAIAVEYLHANGIAHRDLKPENILVMRTGIGHRVVLTDFGCAGYIGRSHRMLSTAVGTYDYVAPEVHKSNGSGYSEAIDMWSLGIITLCLLIGDPFISFEELQGLTQVDIAVKLAETSCAYPQWRHLNVQGKDFIKKLLVLDPPKRMTAKGAVNHDWFRKPTRIAMELDKLYNRSIAFWTKRPNHIGIIEDLPDVFPDLGRVGKALSSKTSRDHPKSASKKIPDASSPYFGLERHLHPPGARTKSNLHSQRKRILAELKKGDSQFIDTTARMEQSLKPSSKARESLFRLLESDCDTDMSGTTAPILRPMEPSSANNVDRTQLSNCLSRPSARIQIRAMSTQGQTSKVSVNGERTLASEAQEIPGVVTDSSNYAYKSQPTLSPKAGISIRDVNANDIFGTVPIEIKAAEAAESERAAYDDAFQNSLYATDEDMYDDSSERPAKSLDYSHTLNEEDRKIHDEAAEDLPKLSTAKAYLQAIERRKKLKGGMGVWEDSVVWK